MVEMKRLISNKNGAIDMADVLVLHPQSSEEMKTKRAFDCKTCNKRFTSFQALGGHRASHKKPRLSDDIDQNVMVDNKPKVHVCSICGVEFAIGQALGGHMRRHRAPNNERLVEKKSNYNIEKRRVLLFGFELPIHG